MLELAHLCFVGDLKKKLKMKPEIILCSLFCCHKDFDKTDL